MPPSAPDEITQLLDAWNKGNEQALNELVALVYDDMRRIARRHLRHRPAENFVQSGTLVHEAYCKLLRAGGIHCDNRVQFFALCSQVIRRILVDLARKEGAAKRGGGLRVPLEEDLLGSKAKGIELLALDEALTALSQIDPRKCRVVELRFFGGLSVAETAEVLAVSEETVARDWKMAKTWLLRELTRTKPAR